MLELISIRGKVKLYKWKPFDFTFTQSLGLPWFTLCPARNSSNSREISNVAERKINIGRRAREQIRVIEAETKGAELF